MLKPDAKVIVSGFNSQNDTLYMDYYGEKVCYKT